MGEEFRGTFTLAGKLSLQAAVVHKIADEEAKVAYKRVQEKVEETESFLWSDQFEAFDFLSYNKHFAFLCLLDQNRWKLESRLELELKLHSHFWLIRWVFQC